jgi:rSAM/selenodomain-associated transferase 2
MRISIVIPTINEEIAIRHNLPTLQWARKQGHEIIVVDGGSQDESIREASLFADKVVSSPQGRAKQMNAGAQAATGDVYLFLHIDTLLPDNGLSAICDHFNSGRYQWGRFDVRLSGSHPLLRIIERMMNWRSRVSSIATGDQAIFITRELFEKINGFANIPLMEDIDISRRLKRHSRPLCLRQNVITSSRRWEIRGIWRTVWLMWRLRWAYWLGADPAHLAQRYYPGFRN